jgi:two-component system LytT family response regulator
MKIRTLIVDDMMLARKRVRQCLADDPDIEIIGECANGRTAIAAIRSMSPDLVFLDVQMPKVGGFEVVEAIGAEKMPTVIFVTAYDEFALRAFDACALDYLLKPLNTERFIRALARAKREVKRSKAEQDDGRLKQVLAAIDLAPRYLKRLAVKSAGQTLILPVDEIEWIGAAACYLELHVGRETHLIRKRLGELEQQLDPEMFVRIHRSTIVNIERIKKLHPLFNDDHLVILQDGTKLNMSRTYYPSVAALLDGL